MKELEKKIVKFAEDRDWLQFNTPENLAKSISIEAGELLEFFQWNNNYDKDEFNIDVLKKILFKKFKEIYYNDAKNDVIPFINNVESLNVWNREFFISITNKVKDTNN